MLFYNDKVYGSELVPVPEVILTPDERYVTRRAPWVLTAMYMPTVPFLWTLRTLFLLPE